MAGDAAASEPSPTTTYLANLGKQFRELFDIKQMSVNTLAEMGHKALESIGVSAFESIHMLIRGIAEVQSGIDLSASHMIQQFQAPDTTQYFPTQEMTKPPSAIDNTAHALD